LDAEGFADGEDLEEEGELVAEALSDVFGEEGLVVLDEVEEGALGGDVLGRVGGVGSHP
jgi:hypothetical protein